MTAPVQNHRLALAAPLVQLAVGGTLLALATRPAALLTLAVIVVLVLPALIGVWVFRGRPMLHRLLLGAWAPAGEVVAFFAVLFGMRFLSGGSDVFLWAVVAVPLVALLAVSLVKLRGAGRPTWILFLVLWAFALAGSVAAIPLSERFGAVGDMYSLAGTLLLLFGPGIAFGGWAALALAARVPEVAPSGAVLVSVLPADVVLDRESS